MYIYFFPPYSITLQVCQTQLCLNSVTRREIVCWRGGEGPDINGDIARILDQIKKKKSSHFNVKFDLHVKPDFEQVSSDKGDRAMVPLH